MPNVPAREDALRYVERACHFSPYSILTTTDHILFLPRLFEPNHNQVVITEALENIYIKVDSISQAEQQKSAHFALLGVQFLTYHHWLEDTVMGMLLQTSY